ncbi:MAG: NAD(P)H-dependent oxidoreductase subunit E, partial [Clostridia bacterium]|nr:NAD(P)H-dependent oxidoreductase subunit E [Clostridia bacterium]
EQEARLDAVIAEHKGEKGALMPILQKAQDIYGYLPIEVQRHIALGMDIPLSEVYGVATFYSQFILNPKGEYAVAVCLGTACYVKGAGLLMDKLESLIGIKNGEITADRKFSLDATRCIGACGLAPVLTVNEEVYGRLTPDMIKGILDKYN